METEVELTVDVALEYEIGSPPDLAVGYDRVANESEARYIATWMVRPNGLSEGVVAESTTKFYPPFTDDERRQLFCVLGVVALGTTTLDWNAEAFPIGRVFLTTDSGWDATGVVIASPGEGSWFACEGELDADFRKWREAVPVPVDPL